jgi:hypothetical protein
MSKSVSSKAKAILKGWTNYLTSDVDDEVVKSRAEICGGCPHAVKSKLLFMVKDTLKEIEGFKCDLCGCPLSAKIRQNDEPCDDGRWQ